VGLVAGAQGLAQRGIDPRGRQAGGELGQGAVGHQSSLFREEGGCRDDDENIAKVISKSK
jgi:hypothetical protein